MSTARKEYMLQSLVTILIPFIVLASMVILAWANSTKTACQKCTKDEIGALRKISENPSRYIIVERREGGHGDLEIYQSEKDVLLRDKEGRFFEGPPAWGGNQTVETRWMPCVQPVSLMTATLPTPPPSASANPPTWPPTTGTRRDN